MDSSAATKNESKNSGVEDAVSNEKSSASKLDEKAIESKIIDGEESDAASNSEDSEDDEEGGENDDDEFQSSDDEEDEQVYQELIGMKRSVGDSQGSSESKKSKTNGDSKDEEECQFVPDDYEELDTANIVPRGKRSAAMKSGLIVQENKFKHLVDDDDDGEAEF